MNPDIEKLIELLSMNHSDIYIYRLVSWIKLIVKIVLLI